MIVRPATVKDAPQVQAIYAHHVLLGDGTFEEVPPTVEEMAGRMKALLDRAFPYVVAEDAGRVRAFAYAGPLRERAAYRFTVEDTVYVADDARRQGFGRAVLQSVIAACEDRGFRQMIALIGGSANAGSIGLHDALGFKAAGIWRDAGCKFGRWLDVVHMQRPLGQAASAAGGLPTP